MLRNIISEETRRTASRSYTKVIINISVQVFRATFHTKIGIWIAKKFLRSVRTLANAKSSRILSIGTIRTFDYTATCIGKTIIS